MCFGTEGLDPVLEGFLDDVLNFPSTEMREEAPKDAPPPPPAATNIPSHWNGEASASQGFDMNGDVARSDSGLGADDEESTMAELRSRPPDVHIEGGSQPIANGRGGDVGARVNGDLSDIGEGISGDGNGREVRRDMCLIGMHIIQEILGTNTLCSLRVFTFARFQ